MGYDSGGLSDHDNAMLDIRNQRLEREAYDREIADLKNRIAELEADNKKLEGFIRKHITADPDMYTELEAKHTALVDGLRELAEKWRGIVGDPGTNLVRFDCADDIEVLIYKEPAPSPPPADDGSQAADGAGS